MARKRRAQARAFIVIARHQVERGRRGANNGLFGVGNDLGKDSADIDAGAEDLTMAGSQEANRLVLEVPLVEGGIVEPDGKRFQPVRTTD